MDDIFIQYVMGGGPNVPSPKWQAKVTLPTRDIATTHLGPYKRKDPHTAYNA